MAVFTVRATQYVSGSRSTVKLADFDILVRHHVAFDRTRKAKLGSKISLMGELDVYEDKLYVGLHNFDFISSNAIQQDTLYTTPSSSSTISEQRNQLYKSLSEIYDHPQPAKRNKIAHTSSPVNNNQSENEPTHSTEHVETADQLPKNQSSQKQSQSTKRELRSSNTNKKISELASNKLNLPPFEDQK
jgi:hypothetical protein